ncbi:MAG TPA: hypothetical protein VKW78_23495 [Terriglobales bacterium]|nr:hypothetical protein [Terriglobales bacterium]
MSTSGNSAQREVVLCIDDRKDALAIRVLLLQTFGYDAMSAHDYASTFQILENKFVDVAIIDDHLAGQRTVKRWRAEFGSITRIESAQKSVDVFRVKGTSPTGLTQTLEQLLYSKREEDRPSVQERNLELRKRAGNLVEESRKRLGNDSHRK